jgi:hypothetical protein
MKTNARAYSGVWKSTKHGVVQADVRDETARKDIGCGQSGRTKDHTLWWTIDSACLHNPLWIKIAFSVRGRAHGLAYQDNALSHSWRHPRNIVYSSRVSAPQ